MKIIIGPPGSGKSTLARTSPAFVDGDLIPEVARTYCFMVERYGPDWWRTDQARNLKDIKMTSVRLQIEARVDYHQAMLTAETALVLPHDIVIVVVPTIDELLVNTRDRVKPHFRYDGRSDAEQIHDYYRRWAVKHNHRVVNKIEVAGAAIFTERSRPTSNAPHVPSLEDIVGR